MFDEQAREQEEQQVVGYLLSNVENIMINGTQLILNQVFRIIGFDVIEDDVFKHLVIARISQPSSKSATVDYQTSYFDEDVELHKNYRYLDKLHNQEQAKVQRISVEHTRNILGGNIGLVFYDVTTLYFESDFEDELRSRGFSKDGKHSLPQVVLGLLVSQNGYPLAYSLFNGSQYEARTMFPVVEDFVKRFGLEDFVEVSDSGLMNKTNITLLDNAGYKNIIGARIKKRATRLKNGYYHRKSKKDYFTGKKKRTIVL